MYKLAIIRRDDKAPTKQKQSRTDITLVPKGQKRFKNLIPNVFSSSLTQNRSNICDTSRRPVFLTHLTKYQNEILKIES